jgi:hypothetical protein
VGDIDTGVYPPFNAVHWNGVEWQLKRIPFTGSCSAVEFPLIRSIFAFWENNIWFARGGSLVHYDGNSYYNDCDMNTLLDGSINKIWGSNSDNIFVVGGSGTTVNYDGSSWQKLESGTQLRLTDIWGLAGNDIYAVGADMSSLDNVVLHYDGISWKQLPTDQNRKVAVWGTSPSNMYFAGDGVYHYNDRNYKSIHWPVTFLKIFSDAIRGTALNNIFVCGSLYMIMHFNGINWHPYEQLTDFSGGRLIALAVINTDVFAVGYGSDQRARIFHGRRIDHWVEP